MESMRAVGVYRLGLARGFAAALFVGLLFVGQAGAVPVLQTWIEGSIYDDITDTWVYSGSGPFTVWVMGNVAGPGGKGRIDGVKLSGAVQTLELGLGGSISLTPTTATAPPGYSGGTIDPSTPAAPGGPSLSADGGIPQLGDGTPLPTHSVYGPGVSFFEWTLGNFTLTDSPVADFISGLPGAGDYTAAAGQVNAYTVTVTNFLTVHFDAYDHYYNGTDAKYVKAPFSHDSEKQPGFGGSGSGEEVPEPASALFLISGVTALLGARRRASLSR